MRFRYVFLLVFVAQKPALFGTPQTEIVAEESVEVVTVFDIETTTVLDDKMTIPASVYVTTPVGVLPAPPIIVAPSSVDSVPHTVTTAALDDKMTISASVYVHVTTPVGVLATPSIIVAPPSVDSVSQTKSYELVTATSVEVINVIDIKTPAVLADKMTIPSSVYVTTPVSVSATPITVAPSSVDSVPQTESDELITAASVELITGDIETTSASVNMATPVSVSATPVIVAPSLVDSVRQTESNELITAASVEMITGDMETTAVLDDKMSTSASVYMTTPVGVSATSIIVASFSVDSSSGSGQFESGLNSGYSSGSKGHIGSGLVSGSTTTGIEITSLSVKLETAMPTCVYATPGCVQATTSSLPPASLLPQTSLLLMTPTPSPSLLSPPLPSPPPLWALPFGDEAGDEKLFPTLDGCSERVDLDCDGFIPALDRLISKIYVCANGVISADLPFYFYIPQLFPGNNRLRNRLIFAPFWVDVDIRREGNVWYGSHRKGHDEVTQRADELVRELSPKHDDFKAEAVYVATWENVPNYPDGSFFYSDEKSDLRNTFQAALITDFTDTFMIYSYLNIEFSGRQSAVIGYTAGDGFQFFNQPGSQTDAISQIGQVKTGNYKGMLFFHLTPTVMVESKADFQCREWYCKDRDRFGEHAHWMNFLVPCPWTIFHAQLDSRYIPVSSSKHGRCYIQRFPRVVFVDGELLTPETECCYQFIWLNFGSPFGGSSSPFHRFSFFQLQHQYHSQLTLQPYEWCCLQSSNCHLYFDRRPSRSTWFYWPPGWGWFFGDPHIRTMDGKAYTFNGQGEYILMKTSDESFVLEGRAEPTGEGNLTATATVFTAFAMAQFAASNDFTARDPNSTVLHVQLAANNTLQVFALHTGGMDYVNITSNCTELSNTSILLLDEVTISRPNNVTIEALFSSDISVRVEAKKGLLTVVFAGPVELMGETRGLLGVWDENPDNDLTARNGTVVSSDASDRTIHFDFGLSWQVTSNESLFYYPDGLGPSAFSFPSAVPVFFDEVNLTSFASPELVSACGGDPVCLFDGSVTGDIQVATQSLATEQTNSADVVILANQPPNITGSDTLFAFVNDTTIYLFTVTDVNDTFDVLLQGTLPPQDEYTFTSVDGAYNFTWIPMSTQTVSIQFLATDSSGTSTLLHLLVRLCACHRELNATCTDGSGDPGESKFLMQSCSCGSGYGGTFCDVDVDGCNDIDCFPGVECTDNPAPLTGATCGNCPNGTVTRNGSCEDVNECKSNATNNCEQKCANDVGSFSCSCNAGYTLNENGKSCDDINECEDRSLCHQTCNNTVGSFACGCEFGFQLQTDQRTCGAIEQCAQPQLCEQLCAVGRKGNDLCSCNQGYALDGNGYNCSDVNECGSQNGNNCDQRCNNTVGSFTCSCWPGYVLNADGHSCDDVNECITLSEPCLARTQICENVDGTFNCLCPLGTFYIDGTCRALADGETPPLTEPPSTSSSTSAARVVNITQTTEPTLDTSLGEVLVTFSDLTVSQLNASRAQFKEAVAEAVSNHCSSSQSCILTAKGKRGASFAVTGDDVIIVSVIQSGADVNVTFYIYSVTGIAVVSAAEIVQALQANNTKDGLRALGLTLALVSVLNPVTSTATESPTATEFPTATDAVTKHTGSKTAMLVGIVGGVILVILISCVVYFIIVFKQNAKVKPIMVKSVEEVELQQARKLPDRYFGSSSRELVD